MTQLALNNLCFFFFLPFSFLSFDVVQQTGAEPACGDAVFKQ